MAIKLLSGGPVKDIGASGRTLGGAAANLLETLQALRPSDESHSENEAKRKAYYESRGRKFKPFKNAPNAAENFAKFIGTTRESLAPQGFGEEVAQGILSQAPLAAIGGGGLAANLARTAGGVTAAATAKHLGASPLIQGATQLGAELLGPGLYNKARSLGGAGKKIGEIARELHPAQQVKRHIYGEAEKALHPYERGSIKAWEPVKDAMRKFNRVETDESVKKIVNDTLENIQGNFNHTSKNANISDVWGSLKSLNKQISSLPDKSGAKPYLKQAATGLNNILEDYRPFNESFWKHRTDANKIHVIQQWKPVLSQIGEGLSSKGSIFGKYKWPFEKFFKSLGEGQRVIKYAVVPAIRHYLGKAISEEIKGKPDSALRAIVSMLKTADKHKVDQSTGPILLSGGPIS